MNAIVYKNYGGPEVFELDQVPVPAPQNNEILVKIHASTVTAADAMMRTGKPKIGRLYLGIKRPKRPVLGFEFAGEVIKTGEKVTQFKVGDRVFGGTTKLGCYAEYACISEQDVVLKMPLQLSFEEAAPVSGSAITVYNFLVRLGNVQAGQKVLIIGASGGLGTYAVQLAKHLGAHVTGVCSGANVELVKGLGADVVIDYSRTNFLKNGEKYDVIFDTVNKSSFSECKRSLTNHGVYLPTVFTIKMLCKMWRTGILGGKQIKSSSTGLLPVKKRLVYFQAIRELLESGAIKTVIDRGYSLRDMQEAHAYVDKGHKKGNVVIRV